ncbi:hypothetical protein D3C71_1707680 [compost metagenome]
MIGSVSQPKTLPPSQVCCDEFSLMKSLLLPNTVVLAWLAVYGCVWLSWKLTSNTAVFCSPKVFGAASASTW